jgi:hypothetical protein
MPGKLKPMLFLEKFIFFSHDGMNSVILRVKLRIIAWLFHLYIQLISLTDKNRDYNICISDKTKFINSFVIQVLTVLLHVFCQNMQFSQLVYFKTIQFRNTITLYCIKTKINWKFPRLNLMVLGNWGYSWVHFLF